MRAIAPSLNRRELLKTIWNFGFSKKKPRATQAIKWDAETVKNVNVRPVIKLTAEDSDTLEGTMRCPDAPTRPVRFVRVSGRVRTSCADLIEAP